MDDTYKTIEIPSKETLFKDRNSKFYGYAFPVANEDAVKSYLELLRKKHHTARHFCYAWQLGIESIRYRANDDGEPSNSAGMPIYGQIQSFEVTNILVVSVRYFGGIKLGVGGLINAYRSSARNKGIRSLVYLKYNRGILWVYLFSCLKKLKLNFLLISFPYFDYKFHNQILF